MAEQGMLDGGSHELLDEYLGRGVDLFQIDPWNRTFKTMMLDSPEVDTLPVRETKFRETYADNLLELSHELGVEAGLNGSYGGVTASVLSKFQRSEKRSEKRHFLKISHDIAGKTLVVAGGKEQLKQLLDPDFKTALYTSNPAELFSEYGTHLARKIRIGGRAEYFCQSTATSRMTSEEFKIAAKAKYQSLGGDLAEDSGTGGSIGGSSSVRTLDTTNVKDVAGNSFIDTLGGSAESAVKVKDKAGWANWASSCEKFPGLLGFELDGQLPIWELVDDSARRTAIYEAYKRRAAKAFAAEILSVTSDVRNHPDARVTVPEGYKLLCGGALDNYKGDGNLLSVCSETS